MKQSWPFITTVHFFASRLMRTFVTNTAGPPTKPMLLHITLSAAHKAYVYLLRQIGVYIERWLNENSKNMVAFF